MKRKEHKQIRDAATLTRAGESHFIMACVTREDVELAAGAKFSDALWDDVVAKASAKGMSIGGYLRERASDIKQKQLQKYVNELLSPIFLNPDGTRRSTEEAEQRLNAWLQLKNDQKELDEFQKAKAALEHKRSSKR